MIESTVRNLFSPAAWRRFWDKLGDLEAAMAVTEGEINDRRILRLEAEVASLRAHVGLLGDADPRAMSAATHSNVNGSDRRRGTT